MMTPIPSPPPNLPLIYSDLPSSFQMYLRNCQIGDSHTRLTYKRMSHPGEPLTCELRLPPLSFSIFLNQPQVSPRDTSQFVRAQIFRHFLVSSALPVTLELRNGHFLATIYDLCI